jgi:hypothetical protein
VRAALLGVREREGLAGVVSGRSLEVDVIEGLVGVVLMLVEARVGVEVVAVVIGVVVSSSVGERASIRARGGLGRLLLVVLLLLLLLLARRGRDLVLLSVGSRVGLLVGLLSVLVDGWRRRRLVLLLMLLGGVRRLVLELGLGGDRLALLVVRKGDGLTEIDRSGRFLQIGFARHRSARRVLSSGTVRKGQTARVSFRTSYKLRENTRRKTNLTSFDFQVEPLLAPTGPCCFLGGG